MRRQKKARQVRCSTLIGSRHTGPSKNYKCPGMSCGARGGDGKPVHHGRGGWPPEGHRDRRPRGHVFSPYGEFGRLKQEGAGLPLLFLSVAKSSYPVRNGGIPTLRCPSGSRAHKAPSSLSKRRSLGLALGTTSVRSPLAPRPCTTITILDTRVLFRLRRSPSCRK